MVSLRDWARCRQSETQAKSRLTRNKERYASRLRVALFVSWRQGNQVVEFDDSNCNSFTNGTMFGLPRFLALIRTGVGKTFRCIPLSRNCPINSWTCQVSDESQQTTVNWIDQTAHQRWTERFPYVREFRSDTALHDRGQPATQGTL